MLGLSFENDYVSDLSVKSIRAKERASIKRGLNYLFAALLHKILSTCTGVESIYLLVRSKKGKDVLTRIDEIFEDPIFKNIKELCPKYRHIVQGVVGDCLLPNLGLSDQDRETLINQVCNKFLIIINYCLGQV